MSVGNNLQEMENVVTKGAAKADPMPKLTTGGTPASYEDLGGPTPQNSKPDDDSNKLKTPGTSLKQVKDVVNKGAKSADPMPAGMKEEEEVEGEVVAETEVSQDEVVSEEEDAVAEHHTKDEEGNVIDGVNGVGVQSMDTAVTAKGQMQIDFIAATGEKITPLNYWGHIHEKNMSTNTHNHNDTYV